MRPYGRHQAGWERIIPSAFTDTPTPARPRCSTARPAPSTALRNIALLFGQAVARELLPLEADRLAEADLAYPRGPACQRRGWAGRGEGCCQRTNRPLMSDGRPMSGPQCTLKLGCW